MGLELELCHPDGTLEAQPFFDEFYTSGNASFWKPH